MKCSELLGTLLLKIGECAIIEEIQQNGSFNSALRKPISLTTTEGSAWNHHNIRSRL